MIRQCCSEEKWRVATKQKQDEVEKKAEEISTNQLVENFEC